MRLPECVRGKNASTLRLIFTQPPGHQDTILPVERFSAPMNIFTSGASFAEGSSNGHNRPLI